MIITLVNCKINIYDEKFYCGIDESIVEKLKNNGLLRRRQAQYKLYINNREKHLLCPMLNFYKGINVVLWPSIKLPMRGFPVHV